MYQTAYPTPIVSQDDGSLHDSLHGANIRRLMARRDLSLADVATAAGLDQRTVRSLIRDESRPHAHTLHKLAQGLGVEVDELFRPPRTSYDAAFDRAANPGVTRAIEAHPELFADWTEAEFDELYSRVAVGGELTEAGAKAAAEAMNRRRELMTQVALILESDQGPMLRDLVELLYRRATEVKEDGVIGDQKSVNSDRRSVEGRQSAWLQ